MARLAPGPRCAGPGDDFTGQAARPGPRRGE